LLPSTAPPAPYPLSLHDALPIFPSTEATLRLHAPVASRMEPAEIVPVPGATVPTVLVRADRYFDRDALYGPPGGDYPDNAERFRSEEHTSELQSRFDLVCRLLLE